MREGQRCVTAGPSLPGAKIPAQSRAGLHPDQRVPGKPGAFQKPVGDEAAVGDSLRGPHRDGRGVLEKIRDQPAQAVTPDYAVRARNTDDRVARCIDARIDRVTEAAVVLVYNPQGRKARRPVDAANLSGAHLTPVRFGEYLQLQRRFHLRKRLLAGCVVDDDDFELRVVKLE